MTARLVFRTHYQAIGFDIFDLLQTAILSPVRGVSKDIAADQLSKAAGDARPLNRAAAGYVLDEAKALGLCNDNYVLSQRALGYVTAGRRAESVRVAFYFRQFIEHDGALLFQLLHELRTPRFIAALYDTPVFENSVIAVYREYLLLTSDIFEKAKFRREIERLERGGDNGLFDRKTRKHKVLFHITAAFELGLIERNDGADGTLTSAIQISTSALGRRFVELCGSIRNLEFLLADAASAEHLWSQLIGLTQASISPDEIVRAYNEFIPLALQIVPVDAINMVLTGKTLPERTFVSRASLVNMLKQMRDSDPRKVHLFALGSEEISGVSLDR